MGVSPSRGVDNHHLNLQDPGIFIGSMDSNNDPLKSLRTEYNPAFEHIYITFAVKGDIFTFSNYLETRLMIYSLSMGNQYLILISGTLADWISSIIYLCDDRADTIMRKHFNGALVALERTSLKECFIGFEKIYIQDGTFVLRRK